MDWIEIKTEDDIKNLLDTFGWFHDGCLREMHLWNSYYVSDNLSMGPGDGVLNAKIIFQRQFVNPSAIEVYFTEVHRINIVSTPPENWYSIFESTFFYKDGLFFWADNGNWTCEEQNNNQTMWISSKGVKWRDKSEWMGNQLRYSSKE